MVGGGSSLRNRTILSAVGEFNGGRVITSAEVCAWQGPFASPPEFDTNSIYSEITLPYDEPNTDFRTTGQLTIPYSGFYRITLNVALNTAFARAVAGDVFIAITDTTPSVIYDLYSKARKITSFNMEFTVAPDEGIGLTTYPNVSYTGFLNSGDLVYFIVRYFTNGGYIETGDVYVEELSTYIDRSTT